MLLTILAVGLSLTWLALVLWLGMSSLTYKMSVVQSIAAQNNVTGTDYSPNANASNITKANSLGTAAANAAIGGSDEIYSAISTLTASASVTLNFASLADLLGTAAVNFVRVKNLVLRVLSATDDATNGTAASAITVDGTAATAFLSVSGSGWLTNATSKIDVPNGGILAFGTPSAAGIVTSGAANFKMTNLDGALSAKAQVTLVGGSA